MRRRRRRAGSAISLFAFQDVMAAVIGVLFFVVLLLSLEMVSGAAAAEREARPAVEEAPAGERIAAAEAEVAALRERLASDVVDAARLAREVEALASELAARRQQLLQTQARLAELDRAAGEDLTRRTQERAEADRLERELARVTAALEEARRGPRLTWLLDERLSQRERWLVEVSGSRIRVAPVEESARAVLTFASREPEDRAVGLLAWLDRLPRGAVALVLLAKPSGALQAEALLELLAARGYTVGADFLPEDWEPIR